MLFSLVSYLSLSHGMMIIPTPRNALDRELPALANGSYPGDTDGCNCANPLGGCTAAAARGEGGKGVGQACMWFSQGCTIGCASCTGVGSHTTKSLCANSAVNATNNAKRSRSMNVDAVPFSANDTYRFNPWRAPGYAPVFDACGMAGGTPPANAGPGEAKFHNSTIASMGQLGSKALKKGPPTATYKAGSVAEVAWGIRYNHGGGYQYRLCPASSPLTEACFQAHPLEFSGPPRLRWHDGSQETLEAVDVVTGTKDGKPWRMNPIPRINPGPGSGEPAWLSALCPSPSWDKATGAGFAACRQFQPFCKNDVNWAPLPDPASKRAGKPSVSRDGDVEGRCSGDWTGGLIVDNVTIPNSAPPGDYVLGFRWDCEETSQVWASCADIRIIA